MVRGRHRPPRAEVGSRIRKRSFHHDPSCHAVRRRRLRRGPRRQDRRHAPSTDRRTGAKPAPTAKPAPRWVMPRTPDGKPDLQGNWTNETQTPLERMSAGGTHADRRTGAEDRRPRAARRGISRQGQRSESPRAAEGWRGGQARRARRTIIHRADCRSGRRRRRRLQRLLAGSRTEGDPDRRRRAQLDHHRSAERPDSRAHRSWQEADGRDRRAQPQVRRVRSSGDAAARRSLPAVVRIERRAADAAELFLQQQLHRSCRRPITS